MRANEFVKECGWEVAKDLANRDKTSVGYLSVEHCELNQDELKRLVESYELVEKCGGLSSAKNLGGDDLYCFFKQPSIPTFSDIAQAIADVESCL